MMLAAFYTLRAFICCVVVHLKLSYKKVVKVKRRFGGSREYSVCVSDAWALLLGLYGRYFYIVSIPPKLHPPWRYRWERFGENNRADHTVHGDSQVPSGQIV